VARKGRARRFREARELKQRDDGLFAEGSGTLADVEDSDVDDDEYDEEDDELGDDDDDDPWSDFASEDR
jgi:hypothetical protein